MSIYVACQCGQAFSAPAELAGQTLPCPVCQRSIIVPRPPAMAPPVAPVHYAQPAKGEEDSPLLIWLSIGGGGLALLLVIGLLIYNGTRKATPQVATTATANSAEVPSSLPTTPPAPPIAAEAKPAATPAPAAAPAPAAPMNPSPPAESTPPPPASPPAAVPAATEPPVAATSPVAAQLPAANPPAAADPAPEAAPFTPPGYGEMTATPDGKFEVWLPSVPQKFDPALDLAAFLPKPKGKVLLAFGKQGPTEMCSISVTPGTTAAEVYGEMERAFPGQPDTKTIKFAGVDARQYDFAIEITEGKFAIRTIAFVIDGTGYTLQTLSITGQTDTEENRAFFASFRRKTEGK